MTRRKSVIEIGAACKTRGRACNDAWKSDERAEGRGEGRRVAAVASQDDETTNGKACDERAEGRGEGRRVASQDDETTNGKACDERAERRGEVRRVGTRGAPKLV